MSRLNTQQRLSDGTRDLRVDSALVSPQRIAPAATQNVGALLQGLVQVSGQVVAQQNAQQKKRDAEDFQITLNSLNMRLSEYNQDPSETNASLLLQDYDSARERFTDSQQQASLIQFGEPVKVSLVKQENQRVASATTGYLVTTAREHATLLARDDSFIESIRDEPFDKQTSAIREQILREMPAEQVEVLNDSPELQNRLQTMILDVQETAEVARRQEADRITLNIRRRVAAESYDKIRTGTEPSIAIQSMVAAGIQQDDAEAALVTNAIDELKTQQQFGRVEELAKQMFVGARLLNSISPGNDRADLASALASAQKFVGESATEILDSRADVLRRTGVNPDAVEAGVEQELLTLATALFGQQIDSVEALASFGPDNRAEGDIKKALMDVYSKFQAKHDTISDTVTNSAQAFADPSSTTNSIVSGLITLSPDQQAQTLSMLQERIIPADGVGPIDYETLALLDAAKTDRAAYFRLVAQTTNDTPYAGSVADQIRTETLEGPVDAEGMRKLQQAFFGFGGEPEDLELLAGKGNPDRIYALAKVSEEFTKTGEFSAETYNARVQEYNSLLFNSSDQKNVDFFAFLSNEKVIKKTTGRGWFLADSVADVEGSDSLSNITFTEKDKNLILAAVDLADIKMGSTNDTSAVAAAINSSLANAGVFVVADTTFGNRGHAILTRNKHIPEAVGQTTFQINKAINNPKSLVDRYMGTVLSDGDYNSVWSVAAEKLKGIRLGDERARSLLTEDELLRRHKEGTAQIVVATGRAGTTSVPIILRLGSGQDIQDIPIANFDFGSETNRRFFNSGLTSKAYKSPRAESSQPRPPVSGLVDYDQYFETRANIPQQLGP